MRGETPHERFGQARACANDPWLPRSSSKSVSTAMNGSSPAVETVASAMDAPVLSRARVLSTADAYFSSAEKASSAMDTRLPSVEMASCGMDAPLPSREIVLSAVDGVAARERVRPTTQTLSLPTERVGEAMFIRYTNLLLERFSKKAIAEPDAERH